MEICVTMPIEVILLIYEGSIYRPPSEAHSLIVQATIGCSHNRCTFCSMYKEKTFRFRPIDEVKQDLTHARARYGWTKRIFLADGNAFAMGTADLLELLRHISYTFPECERIGIYATPKDILRKSPDELGRLGKAGLGIIYLGLESGNPEVLRRVEKGATREEMVEAGLKVKASGIELSVTLINGLGGHELSEAHGIDSATLINAISPDYVGFLTLMLEEGAPILDEVREGRFSLLSPKEILKEILLFLENINNEGPTIFRSNHASNYLPLGGILPQDRHRLIKEIKAALLDDSQLKKESWRQL